MKPRNKLPHVIYTLVSRPIMYSNSTFRKYSNSVGSPKSDTSVWYKLPPVKQKTDQIVKTKPDTLLISWKRNKLKAIKGTEREFLLY